MHAWEVHGQVGSQANAGRWPLSGPLHLSRTAVGASKEGCIAGAVPGGGQHLGVS